MEYGGLNHELSNLDRNCVFKDDAHIDILTKSLINKLLETTKHCVPMCKITVRSKEKLWCTKYIRYPSKNRNRLPALYNRTGIVG